MSVETNGRYPELTQSDTTNLIKPKKSFQNVVTLAEGLSCGRGERDITPFPFAYIEPEDYPGVEDSEAHWSRKWEAFGLVAGTEGTVEKVGTQLHPPVSRQRVGQILNGLFDDIYEVLPEEKCSIPRETLGFNKSSTEAGRVRRSLAHGGYMVRVLDLASQGQVSKESVDALGVNTSTRSLYRRKLGVEIPYVLKAVSPHFKENISRLKNGELDDTAATKFLEEIEGNNSLSLCLKLSQEGIMSPLLPYLRGLGSTVNRMTLGQAYHRLKELGAAMTRTHRKTHGNPQIYYHILPSHKSTQEACQTFLNEES